MSRDFESLLQESIKMHGHLCPGQVLGVRMSLLGLSRIGIDDAKGEDRKRLIVYVEMDRCATDAVQSVSGCTLGHRTLKFMDYGKMAATFVNVKTGKAVRVVARDDARAKAKEFFPDIGDKSRAQVEAYKIMPDYALFDVMDVTVAVKPKDMPGKPLRRIRCDACGEQVQDMREINYAGQVLCRPCAYGFYYRPEKDSLLPIAMQKSHNGLEVRSKIWIEVQGEPVFGRGRRFLLEAIDIHGSINRAAEEINISYRKAWSYINAMEERLGVKLIERQAGGRKGGGATLTADARTFLKKYEALERDIQEIVDNRFKIIFEGGAHV
jgi:formylmethanofuran dehydrogenase subunit E